MKERRLPKLRALAVLGGGAALLTFLAVLNNDSPTLLPVIGGDRMDLYVVEPRGTKYDEQGQRMQAFEAQRLTHFLDSDHSELDAPRFHIFTKKNAVWDGSANTGTLIGENEIRLRDDVEIVERGGITRLTTTALNYFPRQQKVDSAAPVRITRGSDTTTSVGMRADLNINRIELLTRVEGRHVVP